MRALFKMTIIQSKLFIREPAAFFFTLVFPVLLLVLFGVIWGNDPDPERFDAGYGVVDVSVPAIMGLVIGNIALMSIPIATATDREIGVLRRYRATPLRPIIYLAATVFVFLVMGLIGNALLVLVGNLVWSARFDGNWPSVIVGFAFCALAFFAIGYLVASLSATSRIAQAAGMVLYFPMMFLSGAAFPSDIFPEAVRQVSNFLPLTHVVQLMQGLWFGHAWSDYITQVTVLAAILVLGAAISAKAFRWE